jgi:hypothetical protein
MALRPQDRERGLAAFNESRQVRRRAIVLGRVRVREVATRFWLMTFAGLVIFGVVYYRYAEVELAARRSEVLSRQRAVAVAMGPEGAALRDKLESWVLALAGAVAPELVASDASLESIARGPGVYLRLPLSEARDVEAIRRAAVHSVHDGFTSCLFIGRGGDPAQAGPACESTSQCGPGELCTGWGVCAPPNQPFNLQLLNDALRVVGPEWVSGLEDAQNELEVRAIELDLEDTAKHEVPAAVELVRRSRYFSVVLDELPESGEPAGPGPAAGFQESFQERLQAEDHFVRIGIWDIERAQPVLMLRREAAGRFVGVGAQAAGGLKALRAQQRQANNCAVATEARQVLLTGRVNAAGTLAEADLGPSAVESTEAD